MINFRNFLLLIFQLSALLLSKVTVAQDTIFNYNPYWTNYSFIEDPDVSYQLDTAITYFNRYHPAEASFGFLHTGHIGAAAAPMYFIPSGSTAFDIGFHQFDLYWLKSQDVKYFDSKHPYTTVAYQQGSKAEVLGSFIHTQNILPQWSIGVSLNRYRTDGFYQRQVTKITNMDAFTKYASQNGFYHLNFAYTLNSLKVEENGGVENLDVFNDTSLLDKSLQPVLLDSAMNTGKNDVFLFQQAFDFGKKSEVKKNDSVTYKKVEPSLRVQYSLQWEDRGYRFRDAAIDSAFYSNAYLDSVITRDTVKYSCLSNELRFRSMKRDLGPLRYFAADLYLHHDLYQLHSMLADERVQNGIAGIELRKTRRPDSVHQLKLEYQFIGEINLIDRNQGDFRLHFDMDLHTGAANIFSVAIQQSSNHPSYIQQHYLSNHFSWNNSFSTSQTSFATVAWQEARWRLKLSAQFFGINGYIYWNKEALPSQYDRVLKGYAFFLQKDFTWKGFHLDNELQYQSYSNDTVVSFPTFILRQSFYFQNRLFKGALHSKIGIDVHYNNDYYAPAYMPATGQFYQQEFSKLHYYPVADLFITLQVKGVRAFAMMQNINKDLFGPGYFAVYRSPMPDRAFKLGLEWRFWN